MTRDTSVGETSGQPAGSGAARPRRELLTGAAAALGVVAAEALGSAAPAQAQTDQANEVILGAQNTGATARTVLSATTGELVSLADPATGTGVAGLGTVGPGVTGTGTGAAAGVVGTGGSSGGHGVIGTGVGSGVGVLALGSGSSPGVSAVGGSSGGAGVAGTGFGTGTGVIAAGGASGGLGGRRSVPGSARACRPSAVRAAAWAWPAPAGGQPGSGCREPGPARWTGSGGSAARATGRACTASAGAPGTG